MVEQTDTRKRHCYTILIASLDNMIIAYRTAGLRYKLHATLVRALNIITKGEESVRAQCNPS